MRDRAGLEGVSLVRKSLERAISPFQLYYR